MAIGAGIGALGGWLSGRNIGQTVAASNANAAGLNDRLAAGVNWDIGGPLSQFSGATVSQPMIGDDSITDDLGMSDFGTGREGDALASGGDPGAGMGGGAHPSSGFSYSAAGGGSGAGVWQGGGGMHSYQVNSGSLSPSNYAGIGGGIARGRGKENGVAPY